MSRARKYWSSRPLEESRTKTFPSFVSTMSSVGPAPSRSCFRLSAGFDHRLLTELTGSPVSLTRVRVRAFKARPRSVTVKHRPLLSKVRTRPRTVPAAICTRRSLPLPGGEGEEEGEEGEEEEEGGCEIM